MHSPCLRPLLHWSPAGWRRCTFPAGPPPAPAACMLQLQCSKHATDCVHAAPEQAGGCNTAAAGLMAPHKTRRCRCSSTHGMLLHTVLMLAGPQTGTAADTNTHICCHCTNTTDADTHTHTHAATAQILQMLTHTHTCCHCTNITDASNTHECCHLQHAPQVLPHTSLMMLPHIQHICAHTHLGCW